MNVTIDLAKKHAEEPNRFDAGVYRADLIKVLALYDELKAAPKNSLQYLIDNDLTIGAGLIHTCNDFDFIVKHGFDSITINGGRDGREEVLTKPQIIKRIKDLYFLGLQAYRDDQMQTDRIHKIIYKSE